MKANIRVKHIYPVALFVIFLTLWGLTGESNATNTAASPIEWSKFIKSPEVSSTCKDELHSSLNSLACIAKGEKLFSPLDRHERNSKFNSQ